MVICSFFLKGQCRFGDSCKNEHSYNSTNSSSVLLKKPEVDITMLVKFASGDMLKAEKGNQWPLSCYGPYQAKPCFPGFEDKSFEEIRLGFYEAQHNGTVEQYKEQLAQILHEARMKIISLQNPTAEATNVLKDIYFSNNASNQQKNIFGNQPTANVFNNASNASNSVFGNKPQTNSIFGAPAQPNQTSTNNFPFQPQNNSIFGNNQLSNNQSQPIQSSNSIFGNASNQNTFGSNAKSIFGGANQQQANTPFGLNSVFQNPSNAPAVNHTASIFGSNQGNTNVFASNNAPPTNTFGTNTNSSGTNVFSPNTNSTNTNTFGSNNTSQNIFASNISNTAQAVPANPIFGNSPFANPQQSNSVFSPFGNQDNAPTNVNPFLNANKNISVGNPIFSNASTPLAQNSVFNSDKPQTHSASIFGNRPATGMMSTVVKKDDPTVYSRISDLNANDISQYEKACFDFGYIPTRAPALEMC